MAEVDEGAIGVAKITLHDGTRTVFVIDSRRAHDACDARAVSRFRKGH